MIYGVLVPGGVAGLILLFAWRPWRKEPAAAAVFVPALAVAAAWTVARTAHADWSFPAWPAPTSADWIPYLALGAGLVAALLHRTMHSFVAAALAASATMWLMTARAIENELIESAFVFQAVGAGALLLGAVSMQTLARRRPGPGAPIFMMLTCAAAAIALLNGGVASGAEQTGMLAACFGAMMVLGFLRPGRAQIQTAIAPGFAILGAQLLNGHLYAEMPAGVALLLVAAPSAAWAGTLPIVARLRPWQQFLVRTGAVLLVLGVAVAIAIANAPPPNPYEGYGG